MRRAIPLAALAAALLAACVSLGPRPPAPRYWVLAAERTPADGTRAPLPQLGLGPVRMAAYLDRPEIVTRAGPTRLEVETLDRWGAPLEALFTSALAEALRPTVPARDVVPWPWAAGAAPEWSVAVDVLRFDREPDGTGALEARWTLRRGGALVGEGTTSAREPGAAPGIAGSVAALSRTIAALARDVAGAAVAARDARPDPASGAVPAAATGP